jgi:hypothetical protein
MFIIAWLLGLSGINPLGRGVGRNDGHHFVIVSLSQTIFQEPGILHVHHGFVDP